MTSLDQLAFTFFDPTVAAVYLPTILSGVLVTLGVGSAVVATGLCVGLLLAVIRSFGLRSLNVLLTVLIDIVRALPPLVVILVVYFGLPNVGIVIPAFFVLWASLSLVLACFAAEIFWAGITSVPKGQWAAARATGLSFLQALRFVVLPQAVRLAIPPLTSRTISITKNTALGSAIGVAEILGRAQSAQSISGNATPLTMAAVAYVLLFIPLVVCSRTLERRYRWAHR